MRTQPRKSLQVGLGQIQYLKEESGRIEGLGNEEQCRLDVKGKAVVWRWVRQLFLQGNGHVLKIKIGPRLLASHWSQLHTGVNGVWERSGFVYGRWGPGGQFMQIGRNWHREGGGLENIRYSARKEAVPPRTKSEMFEFSLQQFLFKTRKFQFQIQVPYQLDCLVLWRSNAWGGWWNHEGLFLRKDCRAS